MKLKMIAAISVDGALGNDNKLLWYIPEDLQHFKKCTINKTLVIGAETYSALPDEAKQDRLYFILSSNKIQSASPHVVVKSKAELNSILSNSQKDEIWIVGGQKIYEQFIDDCDEIYITWVNKIYMDANKLFPIEKLNEKFKLVDDSNWLESKTGIKYKFCKYIKDEEEHC